MVEPGPVRPGSGGTHGCLAVCSRHRVFRRRREVVHVVPDALLGQFGVQRGLESPPAGAATTPIRGYRKRRSTDMLDVTYAAVVLVFFWTGLLYVRLAGRL